jgi:glycerol-3-phosphate dehydrogenase
VSVLPNDEDVYDVAIVGAGVVGLMVAYRLSKLGKRVVVLEREAKVGMGVTAGQAGVIHVVQLPFSSLESRLARRGNAMYDGLCNELGVRLSRMPALLVVRGWLTLPALLAAYLYLKLALRGEFRTQLMRGKTLRKMEPQIAEDISAGIVVHGYATVDSQSLVSKLKAGSEKSGVEFRFGWDLKSAELGEGEALLKTGRGNVKARYVVNAAGLYSDDVSKILGKDLGRHEAGLGVMAVYSGLELHAIVAPLPISVGSRTKGGAIIPATDGTTVVGPTLRSVGSKEDMTYTEEDLDLLRRKFGPLLKSEGRLVRVYAGVRPLSPTRDFVVDVDRTRRVVNLVGIESPGLTAAPAIAQMVERAILGDPA